MSILEDEFQKLREDLIIKYDELGMRASGEWANTATVEATSTRGIIFAKDYTEQLVNGRAPGNFPPISMIEKWIYDKRIPLVDITISSLAFLIARKIARVGTEHYINRPTDLVSAVITPARIQSIIDKVSEFHIDSFLSDITGVIKELEAA